MMDIVKAEIERKRKQLADNLLVDNKRKYFKRQDLMKKSDEEYYERQALKTRTKLAATAAEAAATATDSGDGVDGVSTDATEASGSDAAAAAGGHHVSGEASSSGGQQSGGEQQQRIMARKDVIKRLRERDEPIILFGETETEAFLRLRRLEVQEPEAGTDQGYRNDFQEAMESVDASYLEEIVKSSGADSDQKTGHHNTANDVKVVEMNTTIEDILQMAQHLGRRRDDARDCDVIEIFMKYLLELWGKKLNARPDPEKLTTQGRIQNAIYTQTQSYLRPLLKQLKSRKVADDILKHLIRIVQHMLERDYVKASDAYLRMAIGNAPWPIGVTMVGIHARTGREKIFAQNIAHVLNDETQRKYIQALKRLMTQCQKLFTTDPSRCVEYTKTDN